MKNTNVHFIVNPVSGGGRTRKVFASLRPEIKKIAGSDYRVHLTRKSGDATRITRGILKNHVRLIVAVGGDGTAQEVVNGFYDGNHLLSDECELGIINSGTGRGLTRTLNLPATPEEQLRGLAKLPGRKVDIVRLFFSTVSGKPASRLFINECQVGIGGKVVQGVSMKHKSLGGTLAFGSAAVMELFRYKARDFHLRIGDEEEMNRRLIGIVAGNGAHCAGGMQLTPFSRPNDGILDVLLIHEMDRLARFWNFSRVYSGKHILSDCFTYKYCRQFKIDSKDPVLVEADGELLGTTPVRAEMLQNKITIRCNIQTP